MDELYDSFSNWNSTAVMLAAVGLAALFVAVIVYDSVRTHRRHSKRAKSLERRAKMNREASLPATKVTSTKTDTDKPAA